VGGSLGERARPGRPSARDSGCASACRAEPFFRKSTSRVLTRAQTGDALLLSELSPTQASSILKRDASRCETLVLIRTVAAHCRSCRTFLYLLLLLLFDHLVLCDHPIQLPFTSNCRMPDASESPKRFASQRLARPRVQKISQ
jgi:hypothetical protein